MTIDEENRQWVWDQLKTMTAVAKSHQQSAKMFAAQLKEADNPEDYYKELEQAALYREIKRAKRVSGLQDDVS